MTNDVKITKNLRPVVTKKDAQLTSTTTEERNTTKKNIKRITAKEMHFSKDYLSNTMKRIGLNVFN